MVKLSSHSQPKVSSIPQGMTLPDTVTGNFEPKAAFLNLLDRKQFGGSPTEDPARHIRTFCDYCNTLKQAGITQAQLRELYFPFSLRDAARDWITDLDREKAGITDWDSLAQAFYKKYFPPEKTNMYRRQLTSFRQASTENLSEAWERYKKIIRECPHHGFDTWFLIFQFHGGLYDESRAILDSAAGGRFTENVEDTEAWQIIEDMATHTAQYGNPRGNSRFAHVTDSPSSSNTKLVAQMEAMQLKMDDMQHEMSLQKKRVSNQKEVHAMVQQEELCDACGSSGHYVRDCMGTQEEVHAFQAYKYNPPYKAQPGADRSLLSYASQNVLNPTPAPKQPNTYQPPHRTYPNNYQKPPYQPPQAPQAPPPTDSIAELKLIMLQMQQNQMSQQKMTEATIARLERDALAKDATIANLLAHTKVMDNQLGQLAESSSTRKPGMLPSKGTLPHESLNAITLRSGTNYEGPKTPTDATKVGNVEDIGAWVDIGDESVDEIGEKDVREESAAVKQKLEKNQSQVDRPVRPTHNPVPSTVPPTVPPTVLQLHLSPTPSHLRPQPLHH